MKSLLNSNAKDWKHAASLSQQARRNGQQPAFTGGGSDLLGMVKERTASPDVLVNLRTIPGQDQIKKEAGGITIGGLITLDTLSHHPDILRDYKVLAEAAGSVATPQIRNFGTLAFCRRCGGFGVCMGEGSTILVSGIMGCVLCSPRCHSLLFTLKHLPPIHNHKQVPGPAWGGKVPHGAEEPVRRRGHRPLPTPGG